MRRITFLLATLLLLGACKEAKKASDRTASPYQELADQYAEFPLTARFYGTEKEKKTIHSKEELDTITKKLEGAKYQVAEVKKGERTKKAPVPFTTSTLQQEASKVLNFSTQKTMHCRQKTQPQKAGWKTVRPHPA